MGQGAGEQGSREKEEGRRESFNSKLKTLLPTPHSPLPTPLPLAIASNKRYTSLNNL
jgi:hypothetical protein